MQYHMFADCFSLVHLMKTQTPVTERCVVVPTQDLPLPKSMNSTYAIYRATVIVMNVQGVVGETQTYDTVIITDGNKLHAWWCEDRGGYVACHSNRVWDEFAKRFETYSRAGDSDLPTHLRTLWEEVQAGKHRSFAQISSAA